MSFELTCVAWTLVLALVQVIITGVAKTAQYGIKWNMGARDGTQPALKPLAARLDRAQANLFETMPLFITAILVASITGRTGPETHLGAMLYLGARVVYLPLYAAGIPVLRTAVWTVSIIGILKCVLSLLAL